MAGRHRFHYASAITRTGGTRRYSQRGCGLESPRQYFRANCIARLLSRRESEARQDCIERTTFAEAHSKIRAVASELRTLVTTTYGLTLLLLASPQQRGQWHQGGGRVPTISPWTPTRARLRGSGAAWPLSQDSEWGPTALAAVALWEEVDVQNDCITPFVSPEELPIDPHALDVLRRVWRTTGPTSTGL